jgi:hypothetical protein
MKTNLVIIKIVLRAPVMLLAIIIGMPFAFLKALYIGVIEVSDAMIDMVFNVSKIDAYEKEQEESKNRQGVEL